ncbi:hypothetical protein BXU08_07515 [Sphingomonas sp. LM7]|nr:hypothetical protein BXU08_07515 [Sphingomonas sp. LM7]
MKQDCCSATNSTIAKRVKGSCNPCINRAEPIERQTSATSRAYRQGRKDHRHGQGKCRAQSVRSRRPPGRRAGRGFGELADYQRALRKARRDQRAGPAPKPEVDTEPAMRGSTMQPMPEQQVPETPVEQVRRAARLQVRDHYAAAVSARALTAINSPAPFAERLVHFWANHFAVSADKLEMIGLAGSLEFEAVRPHVLGSFGDMLHAIERHPAMLVYLDQAQSVG